MRPITLRVACYLPPVALLLALSLTAALAQEPCEDRVEAYAQDDTVFVAHSGAYYNCCAVVAVVMETSAPWVIDFLETETFPQGPCYCMCCFTVNMQGAGFAPGTYTVQVWNAGRTVLFGQAEVVVAGSGSGQPGPLTVLQSDCQGSSSVDDPQETPVASTWGRLKALFD